MKRMVELVRPRPMLVFALAFIIGILLESYLQLGLVMLLLLGLTLLLLTFMIPCFNTIITSLLLLTLAGGMRLAISSTVSSYSLSKFEVFPDSVYAVVAIVEHVGSTKRGTPKYLLRPKWIDNHSIDHGKIILYAKDLEHIPAAGDTLIGSMNLNPPRAKRNPHEFDYRSYLQSQGIYCEAFIHDLASVRLVDNKTTQASLITLSIRDYIKGFFSEYLKPRTAGVLNALILGERSEVDEETKVNFANTGVIHVLAVSGLHVGYVSLILLSIVGLFRLPHTAQTMIVIFGLVFYVVLTGGAASVMRASIMAALILFSTIIERKTDIFNTLATAAFIILLIDPTQIARIGFQLSFSAVLSIVLLYPVFREWIPAIDQKMHPRIGRLINSTVDLFLVSLAAQLGTLALTIFYFNKIPVISLFANLLVVPLIGIIVATGMSSLILGSIIPFFATLWAALLDGVVDFMLWFVAACASYDWAYISTRGINILEVTLLLIGVFIIAGSNLKRIPAIWLILLLLWGDYLMWSDLARPHRLEIVMLDVGQGDAIVIRTPTQQTLVVDTGLSFGGRDMGEDVISPYLQYRNWKTIDLLILSHPHNDHIGGSHYLLEHHPVKQVMMHHVEYESYSYQMLLSTVDSMSIPSIPAYTGLIDSSFAPVYLRVTGPKQFDSRSTPSNVNNISIVFQLLYGESSVLFTGDAEHEIENDQLAFGSLLKSDLIKAPHHGSKTSSSVPYLDLVRPDISLISLGEGNKYRHPSPSTLKHYQERDIHIHRTDFEGAIHYLSDGQGWMHNDWRNGQ